jgi:DNA-binding transcriptional LysR family regulator
VQFGRVTLCLETGEITAERYAACGHVVASRRGHESGPVDEALGALGLARTVVAVVPSFRAALSVASVSDLLALVTDSFFNATQGDQARSGPAEVRSFPLPVRTEPITVSQMWHPRLDADPAHRWLRGLVLATCREPGFDVVGSQKSSFSAIHTNSTPPPQLGLKQTPPSRSGFVQAGL